MKKHFLLLITLLSGTLLLTNCGDKDTPGMENEEEVIDRVTLTFTPTTGSAVVAVAFDPDGDGSLDFDIDAIELLANETYTLTITLENTFEEEDITAEIEEEADEHMFFFAFTNNIFSDPLGVGNVANRANDINYNDEDADGIPIGLSTTWTTGSATTGGTFRVLLKHQPNIKSATSTAADGESDIDITWTLNISTPL